MATGSTGAPAVVFRGSGLPSGVSLGGTWRSGLVCGCVAL